jgi:hypothetical protein
MPAGTHWEWRGFGATSESFKSKFDSYKLRYPNEPAVDKTEDAYVWVPGSPINVKLRGWRRHRFVMSAIARSATAGAGHATRSIASNEVSSR